VRSNSAYRALDSAVRSVVARSVVVPTGIASRLKEITARDFRIERLDRNLDGIGSSCQDVRTV
jgi:hypothetical protein